MLRNWGSWRPPSSGLAVPGSWLTRASKAILPAGPAGWENDEFMTGIVIRIVSDKLDSVDDLKAAAPMMMQLGTAITEVVENKTTPKGWYAVVKDNDGKSTELVYIQKYGATQIVCSSVINSSMGPGPKKEDILKDCDSIKVK